MGVKALFFHLVLDCVIFSLVTLIPKLSGQMCLDFSSWWLSLWGDCLLLVALVNSAQCSASQNELTQNILRSWVDVPEQKKKVKGDRTQSWVEWRMQIGFWQVAWMVGTLDYCGREVLGYWVSCVRWFGDGNLSGLRHPLWSESFDWNDL